VSETLCPPRQYNPVALVTTLLDHNMENISYEDFKVYVFTCGGH
jgi:hypothetical protein